MGDDWKTGIKEGYLTKVIKTGNCIVTVHRPINLTNEERKRIEDQIRIAMLNMLDEENNGLVEETE